MRDPTVNPGLAPPPSAGGVLVAVSGGPDSSALAVLLHEAGVGPLHLAWVRHGFSDDGFAAGVLEALSTRLGCPLHRLTCPPPPTWKPGDAVPEGRARDGRYRQLFACARELHLPVIATAHHGDDQSETRLLQLLRGGDLRALAGIRPVRSGSGVQLWRPLLHCTKSQLRQVLRKAGLGWAEDPTNADLRLRRNRARHRVIPQLRLESDPWWQREPQLGNRAAGAITAIEDRVREHGLRHLVPSLCRNVLLLPRHSLEGLGPALLHHFLEQMAERVVDRECRVTRKHSARVTAELRAGIRSGRWSWGAAGLELSSSWLAVFSSDVLDVPPWQLKDPESDWSGPPSAVWQVRFAAGPRADRHRPIVRTFRSGDRVLGFSRRKGKQWFQVAGVPRMERAHWPVVTLAGDRVWMPGLGVSPPQELGVTFRGLLDPRERLSAVRRRGRDRRR